ncbi:low molecular weight protein-tyrosine-phosphatase [Cysteiniphilum halobium]|uniref:low molecular weight protein-tyrosine-phosphatase n=1 Tax=Cysteiniphilum halobium TaxID=2219059 RepID=UPI003F835D4B
MKKIKVMFVCMGNICRSPTAHGIFRKLVAEARLESYFEIESSGTHSDQWHKGDTSDPRTITTALRYDCDIRDLRSRQLVPEDFKHYDFLIAMDDKNLKDMLVIAPNGDTQKVTKLLQYAPTLPINNVPDPYYNDGFDQVYLMIDTACRNLLEVLKNELNAKS